VRLVPGRIAGRVVTRLDPRRRLQARPWRI
jgi:hypothetical protein